MRVWRWAFHKGMRQLGFPSHGEARVIHDAITQQGHLRPIALPDQSSWDATAAGTVSLFIRRGRTYLSSLKRIYAPIENAGREVLVYFEQGGRQRKIVSGKDFPLGIPRPGFAPKPVISKSVPNGSLTVFEGGKLTGGTIKYYRIVILTNGGPIPPGDSVPVAMLKDYIGAYYHFSNIMQGYQGNLGIWAPANNIPNTVQVRLDNAKSFGNNSTNPAGTITATPVFKDCSVTVRQPRPTDIKGYAGFAVFRGDAPGQEKYVGQVDATKDTFVDDGTALLGGTIDDFFTTGFLTNSTFYLSAYKFSQGGATWHGPASPVSLPIKLGTTSSFFVDLNAEGFFNQDGLQALTFTPVNVSGPLGMISAEAGATYNHQADFGLDPLVGSPKQPYALLKSLSAPVAFCDGYGIRLLDGVGNTKAIVKARLPQRLDGSSQRLLWGSSEICLEDMTATQLASLGAVSVASNFSGLLKSFAYDPKLGGLKVDLGNHSLVSGQKITLSNLAVDGSPATKTTMTFFRDTVNQTKGWLLGQMGWSWTNNQIIKWGICAIYLQLVADGAALTNALFPGVDFAGLDGATVRVTNSVIGTRIAKCRLGSMGLYLDADWTGFEVLGTTAMPASGTWKIEWIPYDAGIVARTLYRTGDTTDFLEVGDFPLAQPILRDQVATVDLGPVLQSHSILNGVLVDDLPPPKGMRSLVSHNGSVYALFGNTIRGTRPGYPDAWPPVYSWPVPEPAMALFSYDGELLCFCSNSIYKLQGNRPELARLVRTASEDGLLAVRSPQETPMGVIFLGTRGLSIFRMNTSRSLSESRMLPTQFLPRRQVAEDGTISPSVTSQGHLMDTSIANYLPWVGAMESAAVLEAMSQDQVLTLQAVQVAANYDCLGSAYHRGRYYLYARALEVEEGQGTWMVDLSAEGMPITHLGLQPIDAFCDGNDFRLLLGAP